MAHEGEGDARVGAERVVTCGVESGSSDVGYDRLADVVLAGLGL